MINGDNYYTAKKFAFFTNTPISGFGVSSASILFNPSLIFSRLNTHFIQAKESLTRNRTSRYEAKFDHMFEYAMYNFERIIYYIRN